MAKGELNPQSCQARTVAPLTRNAHLDPDPDAQADAQGTVRGVTAQESHRVNRGAEAARRYVNRKTTDGAARPWEALGVSERRYYKLTNQFAPKTGTRHEVDTDVVERSARTWSAATRKRRRTPPLWYFCRSGDSATRLRGSGCNATTTPKR